MEKKPEDFFRTAFIINQDIDGALNNLENWENKLDKESLDSSYLENKKTKERVYYTKISETMISTDNCTPQDNEKYKKFIPINKDILTKLESELPEGTSFFLSMSEEDKRRLNKKE